MAFPQSPGVYITERDLTLTVTGPSTSIGGFCGPFLWGPVEDIVEISSEKDLYANFGGPAGTTYNNTGQAEQWLAAASFLAYTNNLKTVRCVGENAANAYADADGLSTSGVVQIWNEADFDAKVSNAFFTAENSDVLPVFSAAYPGALGNSIAVYFCTGEDAFSSPLTVNVDATTVTFNVSGLVSFPTLTSPYTNPVTLNASATITSLLEAGDIITVNGQTREIATVVNATAITVNAAFSGTISAQSITAIELVDSISWSLDTSYIESNTSHTPAWSESVPTKVRVVPARLAAYIGGSSTTTVEVQQNLYSLLLNEELPNGSDLTTLGSTLLDELVQFTSPVSGRVPLKKLATVTTEDLTVSSLYNPSVSLGGVDSEKALYLTEKVTTAQLRNSAFRGATATRYWKYEGLFDGPPGTSPWALSVNANNVGDEIHLVVIDHAGAWTGTAGTPLEIYAYASQALNAKRADGTSAYLGTLVNETSKYIWSHDVNIADELGMTLFGTALNNTTVYTFAAKVWNATLGAGVDDNDGSDGSEPSILASRISGYSLFADPENVDVSLIFLGDADHVLVQEVLDNVVLRRADCLLSFSPLAADTVEVRNSNDALENVVAFRNLVNRSTSYATCDSGHKLMFDRYNDTTRYVALNGDIAGLCAFTDAVTDAWWSPAGFNRGNIRNAIRLAFNPNQQQRDTLYQNQINPVVSFPNDGIILYGDKTILARPSAFGHINVRRLFNVLRKAIGRASKYMLFEFNDEQTRSRFRAIVNPFLRDIQGRRGIIDYRVVCDATNNTGEVIDRGEFVGDIFVKPARSINFIQLNFIAVKTDVSFSELGG